MKKNLFLIVSCFIGMIAGTINGCKKDAAMNPTHIGTTTSFTEEFADVYGLTSNGWVVKDNTSSGSSGATAPWGQGLMGDDKAGSWHGFTAYSYTSSPDEFAYSYIDGLNNNHSISSWLMTPVLSVKNGDKISFFTRGDTAGSYTDRMQVLMNNSASSNVGSSLSSTGDFNTVLFDINSSQSFGGYPVAWTKYEYTFSGISGNMDTRIAFRHYVKNPANARGVGIDQFKFQVN